MILGCAVRHRLPRRPGSRERVRWLDTRPAPGSLPARRYPWLIGRGRAAGHRLWTRKREPGTRATQEDRCEVEAARKTNENWRGLFGTG